MQHKFAQGFGASAAIENTGFGFADLWRRDCRDQGLKSFGGLLPGFTLAFQQADEMPEALWIVPLN